VGRWFLGGITPVARRHSLSFSKKLLSVLPEDNSDGAQE
jgi:hypothetical protein